MTQSQRIQLLHDDRFPLSKAYDPQWMYDNRMGSPCIWLTEGLSRSMKLTPGMRVLDLGCGKAMSSIFLAGTFGVTVFACDLWVHPDENWERIHETGLSHLIHPMHAEAHALPFAKGFFDAVVCINAYQFFGTSDTYLADHLAPLLRENGQFGLALWGPGTEFTGPVPDSFGPFWWPDFYYFHSLNWWRWHVEKTALFMAETADDMDGQGAYITRQWARVMEKDDPVHQSGMMRWNRLIFRRNEAQPDDFRV